MDALKGTRGNGFEAADPGARFVRDLLAPILFTLQLEWRRRSRCAWSAVACAGAMDSRSSCA